MNRTAAEPETLTQSRAGTKGGVKFCHLEEGWGGGGFIWNRILKIPGISGRWRRSLWWDLNEFGGKL